MSSKSTITLHPAQPASARQQTGSDGETQQSASLGQNASGLAKKPNKPPSSLDPAPGRMIRPNQDHGQRSTPPDHEAFQRHGQASNTRLNQAQREPNGQVPLNHVLPSRPGPYHPQEQSPVKPQKQTQNYGQPHSQQSRYTQQSGAFQGMPPADYRIPNAMQHRHTSQQGQPPLRDQQNLKPTPMILHGTPISNYTYRRTPQNRQLYDPQVDGSRHARQSRDMQQNYRATDPVHDQNVYLQSLASIEIPKAEMGQQERDEKENLRLSLEQICRDSISQYEWKKDKEFDANVVALKCFGSLSSGFATHSSDMDLAIISPNSSPPLSSPESEIPRLLERTLLDLGFGARLLTMARVPIIKVCEKPTPKLAQALLDEREKWEKERDSPSMPKVNRISTKEGGKKSKSSKNDSSVDSIQANDSSQKGGETSLASIPNLNDQAEDIADNANPTIPVDSSPMKDKANALNDVPRSDGELVYLYNLAMNEGWYDAGERKIIKNFLSAVDKQGPGSEDPSVQAARIELKSLTQILHRYRAPTEKRLDFPKTGVGIQCDINFSNTLALHNTLLLKCYSLCDPRVRPVILFVKAWAKRRKINSPYHGTLSSYGYVLMVLHFLVNIANPSIVPNLQTTRKAAQDKSPGNDDIIDGYSVRFWRSETEIQDLANHGMLTRNSAESVGSLLRGFFHYYAQQGFYSPRGGFCWAKEVLSLRTERGILTKQEKDWTGARTVTIEPTVPGGRAREIRHRYLLAIEDPFETDHNITRTVVHNGIVAIRDEFRRAHFIIQSVGRADVEDLFAEAENRELLGWRAFGPLPRKDDAATQSQAQPVAGPSSKDEKVVNGVQTLMGAKEAAQIVEEKPTVRPSSEGKTARSNRDQPAQKALNGNQNSPHQHKPSLESAGQVTLVVDESSTPASRDSAKRPTKRKNRRDKEKSNCQDEAKSRPSPRGKPSPAEKSSPPRNGIKPPSQPINPTSTPGLGVTTPSTRKSASSVSKPESATQTSTYIHRGLVCNVEASSTFTRHPASSVQDSSASDPQVDNRIPVKNTDNSSNEAGDPAGPVGGAGRIPSTTAASAPECS